ncbi:MAG: DUF805 domain-containing protein [Novosphingobium sp.]|nr:DUF805 domain-containing protein [Novosphingobium sp.]MBO9604003.1 DUF805 domain-containing protein [Novosphingobium sp.]
MNRVRFPAGLRATRWGGLAETLLSYAPTTKGRASRTELVVTLLATILLGSVAARVTNLHPNGLTGFGNVLLGLLIFLPSFSAILRRLHDVGRDWTSLVVLLVPYVGVIILSVHLLRPSIYRD